MTAVEKYNALDGQVVDREDLTGIKILAQEQGQVKIAEKIAKLLESNDDEEFKINLAASAIDAVPEECLPGMECKEAEEEYTGLEKAVSPDEIYQYITDLMLNTIKEVGHLPWQKEWKESSLANGSEALNWKTKKKYRGINYFLLNFQEAIVDGKIVMVPRKFTNPYFLTFNQIKESGGVLKKGSKGTRIVYFTRLYKYDQAEPELSFGTYSFPKMVSWLKKNRSKISLLNSFSAESIAAQNAIPILKYYNVFSAEDVEGVEWEIPEPPKRTEAEKIESADAIIDKMPKAPKISHGGGRAYYMPTADYIQMPNKEDFRKVFGYYSTLFHEMVHSTGHHNRLDRDMKGGKQTKAYAFEELIAEMGAVYLCAESGILFETRDNSAKYLRGWNNRLVKNMEEDNRFFFRAASQAQAASDFILDRDKEGVPAYFSSLKSELKEEKPKKEQSKKRQKAAFKKGNKAYYTTKKQNVSIRKVSIPKKGSSLENENRVYDITYSNGRKAMAIPESKLEKARKEDPKPAKKKVSKPKDTNQLLEEQKKAKIQAKTKAEFEKGLKKLGFEVVSYSGKQKSPREWSRQYKLNYKDIAGVSLEMEFEHVGKATKRKDEPQFAGTSKVKAIGLSTDDYIYYDNAQEFYEGVLTELRELFDMSVSEAADVKKEFANTLFQPEKPKTQLGLFGAKKKKTKRSKEKGLAAPVESEPTAPVADPQPVKPVVVGNPSIAQPPVPVPAHKPEPIIQGNPNSLAARMQRNKNRQIEYYQIDNLHISKFLGKVEIKEKESVGISITAPQGAGKTRFAFQLINAFAKNYKVGHASMEEHPDSGLYESKAIEYIEPGNLANIDAPDINNMNDIHRLVENNDVIVIDSWEKLREIDKNVQVDQSFRKKYDGKLFIFIFQLTSDGKMRGGSKSQFDVDIVLFTEKFDNYKENYIYPDKNRYNDIPTSDLKFNIYNRALVPSEATTDVSDVTFEEEPDNPQIVEPPTIKSTGRLIATPVM